MAQTALAFHHNEAVGYTMGLTDKEVERIVKEMLRGYKKLSLRIRAAKARSKQPLTGYEKQLALVGRAYAKDAGYMHKEKAERLFAVKVKNAVGRRRFNDADALSELSGLMVGSTPFAEKQEGTTDWNGKVVTEERENDLIMAEIERMSEEAAQIDEALQVVETYYPLAAEILRHQYIDGWKVARVIEHLKETDTELGGSLADSTYHEWRKEAIHLFGVAAGLC